MFDPTTAIPPFPKGGGPMSKLDRYLPAALPIAILGVILAVSGATGATGAAAEPPKAAPDWSLNATLIEACSCSMFCPCYFSTKPSPEHAGHGGAGEHYCRFNIVYKVNKG